MFKFLQLFVLTYAVLTPIAIVYLLHRRHLKCAGGLLAPWGFLGVVAFTARGAREAPFLAVLGALVMAAGVHFYAEGLKADIVEEIAEASKETHIRLIALEARLAGRGTCSIPAVPDPHTATIPNSLESGPDIRDAPS